MAQEEAIILWDAAAKTQHFVRRAVFDSTAKDFGFLVPTPTQPQLSEADDWAFGMLSDMTRPRVVHRQSWWDLILPAGDPKMRPMAAKSAPPPASVTVLATARVGGYDAAVLEATDAGALDKWLKEHGYASSPELLEWYKPYIAAKWKITAFKIAAQGGAAATSAVRMSFATDRPFFPYREPASAGKTQSKRLLRVFLVANARFDGTLGEAAEWPGKVKWSAQMDSRHEDLMQLVKLPRESMKGSTWMTEFEDEASPRPGRDEVFFKRASDQSTMRRPDIVQGTPLWFDIVSFAIVAAILYGLYRAIRALVRMK